MKHVICLLLGAALVLPAVAQQEAPERVGAGATTASEGFNLPVEMVGPNDLLGITVYDSPELTRTVRVEADGAIRLPMVRQRIQVAGLYPAELEKAITSVLVEDNVLVEPVVTVSVLEYRSRPITVAGAVRTPTTFQADGTITLLDAVSRAGGLTENAGPEILVSHPPSITGNKSVALTERIPVQSLLDIDDAAANLKLESGDIIRVPVAGQVYVVGDVKKPGAFYITDASGSSVLKALAFSEGLDSFSRHTAYIYRIESGRGGRTEIPIQLKKIMEHKSPDVALMADDILYVPDASGRRIGTKILETSLGLSLSMASLLLYATQ